VGYPERLADDLPLAGIVIQNKHHYMNYMRADTAIEDLLKCQENVVMIVYQKSGREEDPSSGSAVSTTRQQKCASFSLSLVSQLLLLFLLVMGLKAMGVLVDY